jgi:hypothetical protein
MRRLSKMAGASLIGLGVLAAPALSQDKPPALEGPAPRTAPKQGGASEGSTPGNIDRKANPERESDPTAPDPSGCPLYNRRLELIV